VKYAIAIAVALITMIKVMEPQPASAYWYYRNSCVWSISSHCAQKRAAHKAKGLPLPTASTAYGR
jgi:hypothetical protein